MGGAISKRASFSDLTERLEARVGKIPLSGRYHRRERKFEDDYEAVNKVLGSGYSGVVRMATRKNGSDGQKFAIKAFKLSTIPKDKRGQLESEVEVYLCMDHPHITRLFDVYKSDDRLTLVMECMEGGELFDRVSKLKRFSERDAADAVWQMLLAVNYLHTHGIVHRDLKLENFLYDAESSDHLKLIDFGFSKMWDPNIKMQGSCGTLAYVAPEVLGKSYTSQCDLWSLGVIVFVLLSGYMPFSGSEEQQTKNIRSGTYKVKPDRWNSISEQAKDFVWGLMVVDPAERLTAEKALAHDWIAKRHQATYNEKEMPEVVEALRQFGQATKFRRCCMEMMAWSLSNAERAKVRQYFVAMDQNHQGTITLQELKKVLEEKFQISAEETKAVFKALDSNNDDEIHYSDFLAAMVSTRIALHDDLLQAAFKKFDTDSSGFITPANLKEVLGDTVEGEEVEKFVAEADQLKDGRISYAEFVSYLRGDPLGGECLDAAEKIIDAQLEQESGSRRAASKELASKALMMLPRRTRLSGGSGGGDSPRASQGSDQQKPGQQQCCCVS